MTIILAVSLENKPGSLADILDLVGSAGINIHAIDAEAQGDFGSVHLQTADPVRAAELLRSKGYDVLEADVIELVLPNKPGVLADVARKLSKAKINVVSVFGTTPVGGSGQGRLLLRCTKPDEARKLLNVKG